MPSSTYPARATTGEPPIRHVRVGRPQSGPDGGRARPVLCPHRHGDHSLVRIRHPLLGVEIVPELRDRSQHRLSRRNDRDHTRSGEDGRCGRTAAGARRVVLCTRQIIDAHVAQPGLAVVEVAAADDETAFAIQELLAAPPQQALAGP
ncbi:DUF6207 family protein [Streptomyces sp. AC550_RSS872]|uniref:DUF6207 family protein n=1 Tax=Streptomyces sp. AC550_RSS872 TaxID=2823689 RepID=UPI0026653B63|nr:DUF6207 family protein [Streptomyces sp. AC550_RSS872]